MRLDRISSMLSCEPMLMHPLRLAALSERVNNFKAGAYDDIEKAVDARVSRPELQVIGNVAIAQIRGVMVEGADAIDRYFGFYDMADFRRMMMESESNPDVDAVVVSVDSPGGSVIGVEESGDIIKRVAAKKPVITHTQTIAASGGQWITASGTFAYTTASAIVGSIGVYMAILDYSGYYQKEGVKVDLIKSDNSPFKAAGFPGTSLTDDQRKQMQSEVNHIKSKFDAHIKSMRPGISEDVLRGQTFTGDQAVSIGLYDAVSDLKTAIKDAARLANG